VVKWGDGSCDCACPVGRSGDRCEVCDPQDCAHGGVWNAKACACDCPAPWKVATHCATCDVPSCGNGAAFNPTTCTCACTGAWSGPDCGTCTVSTGAAAALCGRRGWNAAECRCNDACPPLSCANGGALDPATCTCTCNRARASALKPAAYSMGASDAEESGGGAGGGGRAPRFAQSGLGEIAGSEAGRLAGLVAARGREGAPQSAAALLEREWDDGSVLLESAQRTGGGDGSGEDGTSSAPIPLPASTAPVTAASLWHTVEGGDARFAGHGGHNATTDAAAERTYWSGDRCDVCVPPASPTCPASHTFDFAACGCIPLCSRDACRNGGVSVLLGADATATGPGARTARTCGCRCPVGWAGTTCELVASGATAASAGRSCLAIRRVRPKAASGRYWINPSGVAPLANALQVWCEMEAPAAAAAQLPSSLQHLPSPAPGAWVTVAVVGERLRGALLDRATFTQGVSVGGGSEYVLPCARLDGLDGVYPPPLAAASVGNRAAPAQPGNSTASLRHFVIRVTMGRAVDYFTAAVTAGSQTPSLCDVLTSSQRHWWSPVFTPSLAKVRPAPGSATRYASGAALASAWAAAMTAPSPSPSPSSPARSVQRPAGAQGPRFALHEPDEAYGADGAGTWPWGPTAGGRVDGGVPPGVYPWPAVPNPPHPPQPLQPPVTGGFRPFWAPAGGPAVGSQMFPAAAAAPAPASMYGPVPFSPAQQQQAARFMAPSGGGAGPFMQPQLQSMWGGGAGAPLPPTAAYGSAPMPWSGRGSGGSYGGWSGGIGSVMLETDRSQQTRDVDAAVQDASAAEEVEAAVLLEEANAAKSQARALPPHLADVREFAEEVVGDVAAGGGGRAAAGQAAVAAAVSRLFRFRAQSLGLPDTASSVQGADGVPVRHVSARATGKRKQGVLSAVGATDARDGEADAGEAVLLEAGARRRNRAFVQHEDARDADGDAAAPSSWTPSWQWWWVQPSYVDLALNPQLEGVLGGSGKDWPRGWDGRLYLSLWGGNKGGCCHNSAAPPTTATAPTPAAAAAGAGTAGSGSDSAWGRGFTMAVMEVDAHTYRDVMEGGDLDDLAAAAGGNVGGSVRTAGSGDVSAEERGPVKDEADPMEAV